MTMVGPTLATRDAAEQLRDVLMFYGLPEALAEWAWSRIISGDSDIDVLQQLRERPEYLARFPAMADRRAAGLPAISEAEYLAYERQRIQLMRAAGLPEGFYDDPEDFRRDIANDVSIAELSQRVQLAQDALYNEPPEVLDFYRAYGLDDGDLTAALMDPDRALPVLQRKVGAAQRAGAAVRTGFGTLTEDEAGRLVDLGVTNEQAQTGFSDLARGQELFTPLTLGEESITRDEQLGATFGGDAAAKRKIENRQKKRVGEFDRGGAFSAGRTGYSGLG